MKDNTKTCFLCSRKHKIIAWAALIGIFICGMMVGVSLWGYKHAHTADSKQNGLVEYVKQAVEPKEKLTPCEMREKALMANLVNDIDDSRYDAADSHKWNASVYEKLVIGGCPENREKNKELAQAEMSVFYVLNRDEVNTGEPCKVIESTLMREIITDCGNNTECHLNNAEIYSKMVEDGCKENQGKYGRKALDELQIADGVRIHDSDVRQDEIRAKVNTYKKLQMQNEARKYINKVEKLVNPGVDFIMELQRVIEE